MPHRYKTFDKIKQAHIQSNENRFDRMNLEYVCAIGKTLDESNKHMRQIKQTHILIDQK